MNLLRDFFTLLVLCVCLPSAAGSLSVGSVTVDNVGLNKRLIRLDDNGIIVDNSGMCLEVSVGIKATDMSGRRVLCIVNPLDEDGNTLADRSGEAMSVVAITIPSANYNGKLMVPMPYQWVVTDQTRALNKIKLGVSLLCIGDKNSGEFKIVDLDGSTIKVDRSNMGAKLMGDMFGGSGGGGLGSLLGGLLGGSDAESTEPCPSCEGTGVCPHCDGDGFLDPKSCRKCASDPGICRRCKGEGTITVKYDIY